MTEIMKLAENFQTAIKNLFKNFKTGIHTKKESLPVMVSL